MAAKRPDFPPEWPREESNLRARIRSPLRGTTRLQRAAKQAKLMLMLCCGSLSGCNEMRGNAARGDKLLRTSYARLTEARSRRRCSATFRRQDLDASPARREDLGAFVLQQMIDLLRKVSPTIGARPHSLLADRTRAGFTGADRLDTTRGHCRNRTLCDAQDLR